MEHWYRRMPAREPRASVRHSARSAAACATDTPRTGDRPVAKRRRQERTSCTRFEQVLGPGRLPLDRGGSGGLHPPDRTEGRALRAQSRVTLTIDTRDQPGPCWRGGCRDRGHQQCPARVSRCGGEVLRGARGAPGTTPIQLGLYRCRLRDTLLRASKSGAGRRRPRVRGLAAGIC